MDKKNTPTWTDLLLTAGGFGSIGLLAAAVMNSDRFKPVTREKILDLFDEHAYLVSKASRLDREALDLYGLQLEHLARGESVPVELDLRALEAYRTAQIAKVDASKKLEDLERDKALLLAQLLDERRRGWALASALRMLSHSLWECAQIEDGPPPSSPVRGRDEVLEALVTRRGVTLREAEALLDAVSDEVETVLRSGAVPDGEWSLFEESFSTIDGGQLENWKYEKSIRRLDEALVRAIRPSWREGEYPEKTSAKSVEAAREPAVEPTPEEPVREEPPSSNDWTDPGFVADRLLADMSADSGVTFVPPESLRRELLVAVEAMMASGLSFTPEVTLDIASGGVLSEIGERYGSHEGYETLSGVLDRISDGPVSGTPGAP